MSLKLPLVLIVGGIVIGGISWFGYQYVNKTSDEELILETLQEARIAEEQSSEDREALMRKILPVPSSCATITVKSVSDICDTEPDDFVSWPNWALSATPQEQTCLLDTFYQTNAHASKINGENYERSVPTNRQMGNFACDIYSSIMWIEGDFDINDTTLSITEFITGFYRHRADSNVKPAQSY